MFAGERYDPNVAEFYSKIRVGVFAIVQYYDGGLTMKKVWNEYI